MAWFRCSGGGSGGGGNYTDDTWDGSLIDNVYIATNGEEVPYGGWSATDYLDVSGHTSLYRNGGINNASYNAWYDENKVFISYFGSSQNGIDIIPNNAKFVRYSSATGSMQGKLFTEV